MMLDKLNVKRSQMWLLGSIFAGAVLALGSGVSHAQRRPPGTALLSEMSRQVITTGNYWTINNEDVSVGREIFQASAAINRSGDSSIYRNEPVEVVFRLAASNQAPQYRKLTLAFGVADDNGLARDGSVTRLSIYRDGEFYGYTDVSWGQQRLWVIDVANTRSLALEASCTRPVGSSRRGGQCAAIFFFEEILEP